MARPRRRSSPETSSRRSTRANDRLHAVVTGNPKRFAAFAALPTRDPKAAADELERTHQARLQGRDDPRAANGVFLDDKRFWPIYERAQALDVPIYLHPAGRMPAVFDAYYKDYAKDFPIVIAPPGASRSRPRRRRSAWC